MIKLPDGELRDYLPATMKNDVDMICLSHAIRKATQRLIRYQKGAMSCHFIDSVPEPVLDLLAAELRSLYYSDTLPVETKRGIIKNTLRWHAQAGTPGAVEEMVKAVFGGGRVVEWPDFNEPPYTPGTFDIITDAQLTPDVLEHLAAVIDRVKNVRSHLRRILILRKWPLRETAGVTARSSPHRVIMNHIAAGDMVVSASVWQNAAAAAVSTTTVVIENSSVDAVWSGCEAQGMAFSTSRKQQL